MTGLKKVSVFRVRKKVCLWGRRLENLRLFRPHPRMNPDNHQPQLQIEVHEAYQRWSQSKMNLRCGFVL